MFVMGQALPSKSSTTLETTRLIIRDPSGIVRARLGLDRDSPEFALYDSKGTKRAHLRLAEDGGPQLALFDQNGRTGAATMLVNDEAFSFLNGTYGHVWMYTRVPQDVELRPQAGIVLRSRLIDKTETKVMQEGLETANADELVTGYLRLGGPNRGLLLRGHGGGDISLHAGSGSATLSAQGAAGAVNLVARGSISGLGVENKDGVEMVSVVTDAQNVSTVALRDKDTKARLVLSTRADGSPSLRLLDKDGNDVSGATPAQGRTWVLWSQLVFSATTPPTKMTFASGAWPTQSACQTERARREAARKELSGVAEWLVCLPDSVTMGDHQ
jgi:hypothetical protein